jgi:hypothetical protein
MLDALCCTIDLFLICFKSTLLEGLTRPTYAGQKKSQILSSWTKTTFQGPPRVTFP